MTPPRFTQPLSDTSATDGDELILNAVVTGFPTPHISWFHNNENIDKSEDFVLNFDRNTGRCECVIVECLPDDQGTFRYKVSTFNVCSINITMWPINLSMTNHCRGEPGFNLGKFYF